MSNRSYSTNSARAALQLVLLLAAAAPPLLVDLGRRDAARVMENVAMATSQETWFHLHGMYGLEPDRLAWLLPSYNARPRIVKPPLVTWVHLLSFTGLDPARASCEDLVLRARLTSVAAALLLAAGMFLLLRPVCGETGALLSAAIVASMYFVQRYARTASYDIHLTLWLTLALLLFLRGAVAEDHPLHWSLGAGFCVGLAWLAKGPQALLLFAVPAAVQVWLLGRLRSRLYRRLLLAAAVAVLTALPWYAYVFVRVSGAWDLLFYDYISATLSKSQPW